MWLYCSVFFVLFFSRKALSVLVFLKTLVNVILRNMGPLITETKLQQLLMGALHSRYIKAHVLTQHHGSADAARRCIKNPLYTLLQPAAGKSRTLLRDCPLSSPSQSGQRTGRNPTLLFVSPRTQRAGLVSEWEGRQILTTFANSVWVCIRCRQQAMF